MTRFQTRFRREASGTPRCSFRAPAAPGRNPWPPARRALVPAGAEAIRLCRYRYQRNLRGADGDELVAARTLSEPQITALVRDFDALRRGRHPAGFTTCFFDPAPIVAHVAYPGGRFVTVYVAESCWSASNGDVTRGAGDPGAKRLNDELLRLLAR